MTDLANELTNDSNDNTADSWLSSLPPELQKLESLNKFKDVGALAGSYLELEKSLSSRVAIPQSNATEEERRKFYTRLGCPEDGRYTDNRPAEDEPYLQKWEKIFTRNGLTTPQGNDIFKEFYNDSAEWQKRQEEVRNSNLKKLESYYNDKGGFDSKIDFIKLALNKYAKPDLVNYIEDTHYNPEIINLLVNVGETLKSDSLVTGNSKAEIIGAESALKEIKKLEASNDFMVKYKDKTHTGHEEAVAQMRQLHEIAYNTK